MAIRFKDFTPVEYMPGEDELINRQAKKRKIADQEHEAVEPADEALSMAARRAKSRQMKKYRARLKVGRKKARMKIANQKVLNRRARKAARNAITKKLTKGIPKADLTPARKQEIERRLDKMGPRVTRLAKKMLPKLRQAEIGKKRG